jgi:hypothetical protein
MRHLYSIFSPVARAVWRAGSCVIRAGRTHYFVCRQRAMSRVSARQSHAVMLFRSSTPRLPPVCIRIARLAIARASRTKSSRAVRTRRCALQCTLIIRLT